MRASEFLLSTLKETPSDAEVISHQLMLRAGLIRRVAAGIYNWMPLGLRVLRNVERELAFEVIACGCPLDFDTMGQRDTNTSKIRTR